VHHAEPDPVGDNVHVKTRERGDATSPLTLVVMLSSVGLALGAALIAGQCRGRELKIVNETNQRILVTGTKKGDDFNVGQVSLPPHTRASLGFSLKGRDGIAIAELSGSPQRHWICSWTEAKSKEPVVWSDDGANCGSRTQ
jgi:hypothetical protein